MARALFLLRFCSTISESIYWKQPKPRKLQPKHVEFQSSCVFNDSRAAVQESLHRRELKQAKGDVKQNISGFALLCDDTYGRGGAEALHQNKPTWEQRIAVWEDAERLTNREEREKKRERETGVQEPGKAGGGLGRGWTSWCSALLLPALLRLSKDPPRYQLKASQAAGSSPRPAIFGLFLPTKTVALKRPLAGF